MELSCLVFFQHDIFSNLPFFSRYFLPSFLLALSTRSTGLRCLRRRQRCSSVISWTPSPPWSPAPSPSWWRSRVVPRTFPSPQRVSNLKSLQIYLPPLSRYPHWPEPLTDCLLPVTWPNISQFHSHTNRRSMFVNNTKLVEGQTLRL